MTKITLRDNRSTIIYYNVITELKTDFDEYLILERMLHRSKSNTYSEGITALSKYLGFERATIYKMLKNLMQKGYIEHYQFAKDYILSHRIKEAFDEKSGNHLKIYHAYRSKYKLSVKQFGMLYLIYSLSKRRANRIAFAGVSYYSSTLQISQSYYNHIKSDFLARGFLVDSGSHLLRLSNETFDWFKGQEKPEDV